MGRAKKVSAVIQVVMMYFWLNFLQHTDSVYSVYLICGGVALFGLWFNYKNDKLLFTDSKANAVVIIAAVFFAFCITLSNWRITEVLAGSYADKASGRFLNLFIVGEMFLLFVSSVIVFWNIVLYIFHVTTDISCYVEKESNKGSLIRNIQRFIIIVIPCISVLILFDYPGTLTLDSIAQIDQIIEGVYSNHHPFYHTMFIKAMLDLGMMLFGDINAAVALYSVAQIIIGALSFTYVLSTMEKLGVQREMRVFWLLWFIIMPYNVIFSMTMWKDVIFAYATVIIITALYRLFKNTGNRNVNYITLGISSIIFCLFRSNGFFAFVIMTGVFILLFHQRCHLKTIVIMLAVIVLAFLLKHPVLSALNVSQPRTAEGLSIPEQQIARVITDGKELTEEEEGLINKLIDIDKVPELYLPYLSDPIKFSIDDEYLKTHKREYLNLWINIGMRYPVEYILAWIDQTRGFWNGGYESAPYTYGIFANEHGIESRTVSSLYLLYMQLFRMPLLGPLIANGFHFWILCLCSIISILRKKKEELFLTIPIYAIWLSLLIATPAFNELRYIYSIYICLPFIIVVSLTSLNAHPEKHT